MLCGLEERIGVGVDARATRGSVVVQGASALYRLGPDGRVPGWGVSGGGRPPGAQDAAAFAGGGQLRARKQGSGTPWCCTRPRDVGGIVAVRWPRAGAVASDRASLPTAIRELLSPLGRQTSRMRVIEAESPLSVLEGGCPCARTHRFRHSNIWRTAAVSMGSGSERRWSSTLQHPGDCACSDTCCERA